MDNISRWKKAAKAEANHQTHEKLSGDRAYAARMLEKGWNVGINDMEEKNVLAVGGGTGIVHFLKNTNRSVSVDPLYNNKELDLEKSNCDSLAASGEQIPIASDTFDFVISNNVLDHTAMPKRVLKEIRRVLNPDGRFLFGVNTFDIPRVFRRILDKIDAPHPHHFSTRQAHDLLTNTGFDVIDFSRSSKYPSESTYSLAANTEFKKSISKLARIRKVTAVCSPVLSI
jgi:ubiquinone/menaquinone biosynthesis C-methylase UbiE